MLGGVFFWRVFTDMGIDVDNAVAAQKKDKDPTGGRGLNGHITQQLESDGI